MADADGPGAVLSLEEVQALGSVEETPTVVMSDSRSKEKEARPPRPRRIDVDDITMESIPLILADNPRGLIMVRDECSRSSRG